MKNKLIFLILSLALIGCSSGVQNKNTPTSFLASDQDILQAILNADSSRAGNISYNTKFIRGRILKRGTVSYKAMQRNIDRGDSDQVKKVIVRQPPRLQKIVSSGVKNKNPSLLPAYIAVITYSRSRSRRYSKDLIPNSISSMYFYYVFDKHSKSTAIASRGWKYRQIVDQFIQEDGFTEQ